MNELWYVVDYADDIVVNAGTFTAMQQLIKQLYGGLALVQYDDLTPQMERAETTYERMRNK